MFAYTIFLFSAYLNKLETQVAKMDFTLRTSITFTTVLTN